MRNFIWGRTVIILILTATGFSVDLFAQEIVVESVFLSTVHSAKVPAKDLGVLKEMLVKEGDVVKKNEPLALLDQREAQLAMQLTKQELKIAMLEQENKVRVEFAKKSAKVAEAELKRAIEANRKYPESVSKTETDRLKLLVEKAALDIQQAEHDQQITAMTATLKSLQVKISEYKLNRLTIRAPVAGVVVELKKNPGEWVEPGDVLVEIIDTTILRASAVLSGKHRDLILKGKKVRVELPQLKNEPGKEPLIIFGRVTFIHPEIDPVDGTFRLWAELDNRAGILHPGDSVRMTILGK